MTNESTTPGPTWTEDQHVRSVAMLLAEIERLRSLEADNARLREALAQYERLEIDGDGNLIRVALAHDAAEGGGLIIDGMKNPAAHYEDRVLGGRIFPGTAHDAADLDPPKEEGEPL